MIYSITSRKAETDGEIKISIKGPYRVKVPGRAPEDHPYIGFASQELGETYMKIKNIPAEEFFIVPFDSLLDEERRKGSILIYENEKQILDVEKNSEGYDYESLIRQHAL
jgi:hypothetical protein